VLTVEENIVSIHFKLNEISDEQKEVQLEILIFKRCQNLRK